MGKVVGYMMFWILLAVWLGINPVILVAVLLAIMAGYLLG